MKTRYSALVGLAITVMSVVGCDDGGLTKQPDLPPGTKVGPPPMPDSVPRPGQDHSKAPAKPAAETPPAEARK
jgi:hypothetical protein